MAVALNVITFAQQKDSEEWERLRSTADVAMLQQFIVSHPSSKFADLASHRIDEIEWERVDKKDPAAVKAFLRSHPDMNLEAPGSGARERAREQPAANTVAMGPPAASISAPAQTKPDNLNAFENALDRMIRAYEARSVDQLREAWPSISTDFVKRTQKAFKEADRIRMTLRRVGEPEIDGDTALITCWRTIVTVYSGSEHATDAKIVVRLRRTGGDWFVDAIF